ncbi:MAG: toprim domain-containing protein [Bacteroidota bacterium]
MITWDEINLKGKVSGTIKTTCPVCSSSRKKQKEPCLSVNIDKGLAKCWHCEEIGIRDYKESKEYDLPDQEWRNYTKLQNKTVKWFAERGISQSTLIECKITEEKHYQPAAQKEMNNIVFNYFEGDTLINKKYRSGQKHFTQEKNAKKIFYGINDIIGEKECYIVEGEMDKLSFWEIGIKNCISVPNGANDTSNYFESCEKYMSDIERFFIAVDMDDQGRKLEQDIIKRLGKHKCSRVNFKNKDANDDLIESKLLLEESVKNKTIYPVDGTFTASNILDDILSLYRNGYEQTISPANNFSEFSKSFSVIPGQLTTVTGIPSHGKSSFIEWYVLNMVNDLGKKVSFYSPEHFPMSLHQSTLIEKVTGKSFMHRNNRVSELSISKYSEWSENKIYLTVPEKAILPDWDWVFNKFEEQIFRYSIDLFVIDAWNKVKLKTGTLTEMNEVLARLTLFCQMHNVNIFLIAHPTKMRKNEETGKFQIPTLYDVKGTGDFYDQTHNGLTVYRDFEEGFTKVIVTKIKFRHQGKQGSEIIFNFDDDSGRFYESGSIADRDNWLKEKTQSSIPYDGFDADVGF